MHLLCPFHIFLNVLCIYGLHIIFSLLICAAEVPDLPFKHQYVRDGGHMRVVKMITLTIKLVIATQFSNVLKQFSLFIPRRGVK